MQRIATTNSDVVIGVDPLLALLHSRVALTGEKQEVRRRVDSYKREPWRARLILSPGKKGVPRRGLENVVHTRNHGHGSKYVNDS